MQPLYGRFWIIIADYEKMRKMIGELSSEKRRG